MSVDLDKSQTPIHDWFELTYASYLVLPRSLLQSLSVETQREFVRVLERIYEEEEANMPHHWPHQANIRVQLRDVATGRIVKDDLANYERGRRRLWPISKKAGEATP